MPGVDVRGGAPGTIETDLMRPGNLVNTVAGTRVMVVSTFRPEYRADWMRRPLSADQQDVASRFAGIGEWRPKPRAVATRTA